MELERTGAGVDANIVELAAIRRLKLDFRRTTIMALLNDLKGHSARQNGKIQANGEQESAYPASAG
jgi:hypothetical protein